jgi:hypothetical protein
MEVVQRAWHCPLRNIDLFQRLNWLFRSTARFLTSWSDRCVGSIKVQLEIAKEVVLRLEMAQDRRVLSCQEESLRQELKMKSLGLSSLQRTIARQESRLLWLSEGDAPMKFFHIHANARRRKKFIRSLDHEGQCLISENSKVQAVFQFFDEILGRPTSRSHAINLELLDLPRLQLSVLANRFTEEEVLGVIREMLPDKSPGPDGFTSRFLQASWSIIRPDIMQAFDALWRMDARSFHAVNEALTVLLPKSDAPATIKDYRPISLIHSLAKLMSKVLANCLAPRLHEMVHSNQSAFIKGRFIQDNFRMVQSSAKVLHARQKPCLLLKIDIARAFDSVSWPFLMEILQHFGFPLAWRNWISVFLSTASSRVMVNGNPGRKICHGRGLRQGDPLSPMLFLLVMEALNALLRKADEWNLFHRLGVQAINYRASTINLQLFRDIFSLFEGASGLGCNIAKCQMVPIRCDEAQVELATSMFPCQLMEFPLKYLGIPLSVHKLPKAALQPLVDCAVDKLPT